MSPASEDFYNDARSTTTLLIFTTSPTATHKTLNHFLLTTGDIDAGPGADYRFHVLTHQDPSLLISEQEVPVTYPGDLNIANFDNINIWSGKTVQDVESFCLSTHFLLNSGLYLLLDDEGVSNQTIIVAERAYALVEAGGVEPLDEFMKVRVPWEECRDIILNLEIANVGFDEFTTRWSEGTVLPGGWYEWRSGDDEMGGSRERRERGYEEERRGRERELRRLRDKGLV